MVTLCLGISTWWKFLLSKLTFYYSQTFMSLLCKKLKKKIRKICHKKPFIVSLLWQKDIFRKRLKTRTKIRGKGCEIGPYPISVRLTIISIVDQASAGHVPLDKLCLIFCHKTTTKPQSQNIWGRLT